MSKRMQIITGSYDVPALELKVKTRQGTEEWLLMEQVSREEMSAMVLDLQAALRELDDRLLDTPQGYIPLNSEGQFAFPE